MLMRHTKLAAGVLVIDNQGPVASSLRPCSDRLDHYVMIRYGPCIWLPRENQGPDSPFAYCGIYD